MADDPCGVGSKPVGVFSPSKGASMLYGPYTEYGVQRHARAQDMPMIIVMIVLIHVAKSTVATVP